MLVGLCVCGHVDPAADNMAQRHIHMVVDGKDGFLGKKIETGYLNLWCSKGTNSSS